MHSSSKNGISLQALAIKSLVTAIAIALINQSASAQMLSFDFGNTKQYGQSIAVNKSEVVLLSRDGRAYSYPRSQVANVRELNSSFTSLSQVELRSALLAEHGSRFEVTGTGNYLVVHPVDLGNNWAARFEDIYRSVYSYISTRGIDPHAPQFPLVAVVQKNRAQFEIYSRNLGVNVPQNVIGFYHPMSNRVVVFDQTGANGKSKTWENNSLTIIHEAAHQVAHNIGIHSRFGDTPSWVVEGFGTLFEAPGVWNSRNQKSQASRINRYQLGAFRKLFIEANEIGWLPEIVGGERLFGSDSTRAYAASWALTFYLSENRPADYASYLKTLSQLKWMKTYSSGYRVSDFEKHFGNDWRLLESQVTRFMNEL